MRRCALSAVDPGETPRPNSDSLLWILALTLTLTLTLTVRVQQLACGDDHIVFISSKGDLFAWGMGASGQLGLGDFAFQKVTIRNALHNICICVS